MHFLCFPCKFPGKRTSVIHNHLFYFYFMWFHSERQTDPLSHNYLSCPVEQYFLCVTKPSSKNLVKLVEQVPHWAETKRELTDGISSIYFHIGVSKHYICNQKTFFFFKHSQGAWNWCLRIKHKNLGYFSQDREMQSWESQDRPWETHITARLL